jgi:hypothetical protein
LPIGHFGAFWGILGHAVCTTRDRGAGQKAAPSISAGALHVGRDQCAARTGERVEMLGNADEKKFAAADFRRWARCASVVTTAQRASYE